MTTEGTEERLTVRSTDVIILRKTMEGNFIEEQYKMAGRLHEETGALVVGLGLGQEIDVLDIDEQAELHQRLHTVGWEYPSYFVEYLRRGQDKATFFLRAHSAAAGVVEQMREDNPDLEQIAVWLSDYGRIHGVKPLASWSQS